ncbi:MULTISPECIES: hypothetical protein [Burkholderia]|uniref:Uncharacterized protein n=1 Tax=Burkholderia aenigmatica TaxID=2015348 RepID=A0A6J5IYN1_9BURK|nr:MULTISPECIES: hypothetical protein [Burkholderia]CAB3963562.1 hypothetical protein BLA3211_02344 [Burkholderia aenigmatica]
MSFFFTEFDDSMRPRGSRDPLGIEHLWSAIGRKLVGNLTTVTRHLDNFIVTLVGFRLCVDEKTGRTDWEHFERFEQLTSRARVALNAPSGSVLGVRRIQNSESFPVSLGRGLEARILDNPRQAGLWGLYSTALAAAGLTDTMRRPSPQGEQIVDMFLASAPGDGWRIATDKQQTRIGEAGLERMVQWVEGLLSNQEARKILAECLLSGGDARRGWHGEVFDQAVTVTKGASSLPVARDFLVHLSKESDVLKDFAMRVLRFDEVLALSTLTFRWLLGCHGREAAEIEDGLATLSGWPLGQPAVPNFSAEIQDREWHDRAAGLSAFCDSMARGAWREATERLFAHHERVANGRGGSPWCYWENDRIKVVMNTAPGVLPAAREFDGEHFAGWMRSHSHGFFLDAFLNILQQAGLARLEEQV